MPRRPGSDVGWRRTPPTRERLTASGFGLGRGQLERDALGREALGLVRAVAERLVRGVPAAAERHHRAAGQVVDVAVLVGDDDDLPLESQGAVVPHDDLGVRHVLRSSAGGASRAFYPRYDSEVLRPPRPASLAPVLLLLLAAPGAAAAETPGALLARAQRLAEQ